MLPGPQGSGSSVAPGNALVHYPASGGGMQAPGQSRLDEQDRAFERPPPRNPELFNPKGVVRKGGQTTGTASRATQVVVPSNSGNFEKEKGLVGAGGVGIGMTAGIEEANGRVVTDGGASCAALVDKLAGISLGGVVGNTSVTVVESSGSGAAAIGASS